VGSEIGYPRPRWTSGGAIVLGLIVTAAFLVPLATWGLVDNDEGYYGLAAKLTLDGEVPYRDFLYLQMPLLPYAYGLWMQVFGFSLEAGRALSVIFALALGALICRHATIRFSSLWVGALAVTLFASTRLVSTWYSTLKTYALSTLLLFAAFALLDGEAGTRTPRRWLATGVLVGLAIDVRLIFVVTVPAFAGLLWQLPSATRSRAAGQGLAGLAAGLVPSLILLIAAPSQFVFGNIGWAAVRSEGGLIGDLSQKLDTIGAALGQWQFVVLLVLAAIAVAIRAATRRPPPLAFWLAVALGFASLLPTPTYTQYFCTTVPFLIFTSLELVPAIRARLTRPGGSRYRSWVLAGASVLAFAFVWDAARLIDSTHRLNTEHTAFDSVTRSSTAALADVIDHRTAPGERVLAFRPLYIFLSHAKPVPGFENDVAPVVVQNGDISDADAKRLKLITNEELEALIAGHGVRLIVGPGDSRLTWGSAGRPWESIVRHAGYRPSGTYEGVTVWSSPEVPANASPPD
jgi:hypothetical protein